MSETGWKIVLPCTRAEAEAIELGDIVTVDPLPVLMTSERVPDDADAWQLEAFFDERPDAVTIAALRDLVPSAAAAEPVAEAVPDADWVTLSQAGIEPVHAGRFYVHTAANKGEVPPGTRALRIEASRAFGTGNHETTAGCLAMLDRLERAGRRFDRVLDLGTGTGLLAFAALHLWPRAHVAASDIDPVSIAVTEENAAINGVRVGRGRGALALAVAPGLSHRLLQARAPYDLIIANVLAGPLIEMAPAIAAALDEGGTLVLAGLLDAQAAPLLRAYRRQGLRLAEQRPNGEWPTLRLVKRPRYGTRRARRASGTGATPDFGSW